MNLSKLQLAGALWLVSTLLIHALILWNTRDLVGKGYPDFTIYFTAGTMVRRGLGRELYDDAKQLGIQREFSSLGANRSGLLPFNHPPFEALLFVPLTYFSYRTAYFLWCAVNLTILATLPVMLRPHIPLLGRLPAPLWTLATLAFLPVFIALLQGQDSILLLLIYVLTFVELKTERFASAGACLAFGLFKFHLVLPLLALLLIREQQVARQRKMLLGFVGIAALLLVISIAIVGIPQIASYPRYVLGLESTLASGAIQPSDMPNLRGLLYLIAPGLPHLNWLIILLSAIVFLIAAWLARSYDSGTRGLVFSLLVLTAVLVSYHCLEHDLSILALPVALLAQWLETGGTASRWSRFAVLAGWMALLFSPLQLVLLMRYHSLGWMSLALLVCFAGLVGELRSRRLQLAPGLC